MGFLTEIVANNFVKVLSETIDKITRGQALYAMWTALGRKFRGNREEKKTQKKRMQEARDH